MLPKLGFSLLAALAISRSCGAAAIILDASSSFAPASSVIVLLIKSISETVPPTAPFICCRMSGAAPRLSISILNESLVC